MTTTTVVLAHGIFRFDQLSVVFKRDFGGETVVDTLHRMVRDEPPLLPAYRHDIPAELQRIVSGCLATDPNERYQSAKEPAATCSRQRTPDAAPTMFAGNETN